MVSGFDVFFYPFVGSTYCNIGALFIAGFYFDIVDKVRVTCANYTYIFLK